MIARRGGVLLVMALLLSACIARTEDSADPVGDDLTAAPVVDPEVVAAVEADLQRQFDAGELDGVVHMLAPSGRPLNPNLAGVGPNGTVVSQRAILSLNPPSGRVEMFEVIASDPQSGPGLQRCLVVAEDGGAGSSCGPADEPPVPSVGLGGATGSDFSTLYELVGPSDMTHFIVEVGEERFAVVTREGHGLLYVGSGFCTAPPTVESAWRGDEELVVDSGFAC